MKKLFLPLSIFAGVIAIVASSFYIAQVAHSPADKRGDNGGCFGDEGHCPVC